MGGKQSLPRGAQIVARAWLAGLIATAVAAVALPAPAALAESGRRVAIEGAPAPGPQRFDRVWVRKYGPASADHVLVLVPGSPSGQGSFLSIANDLVDQVPGLAVWTLDRRGNAFEDVSAFELDDPGQSLDYYFLDQEVGGQRFEPVVPARAGFVHDWGMSVAIRDLHRVVERARRGGRRDVLLGGHSIGGSIAMTYPTWDFGGRPGFRDLEALVFIDGGAMGTWNKNVAGTSFARRFHTVAEARAALSKLRRTSPFSFAGWIEGVPMWPVGVLPELACQYALTEPNAPSTLQQGIEQLPPELLPPGFLPPFPVTNEAFLGYLLTNSGAGIALESFRAEVGSLASSGDPRPWVNGPTSTVPRLCDGFTEEPGNAFEWYYPVRIDVDTLRGDTYLRDDRVSRFLGMRTTHLDQVDTPLYAFETGLSQGGVLKGARRFVRASRIRRHKYVSAPSLGHLDPLVDLPDQNPFLETVVPFLRKVTAP